MTSDRNRVEFDHVGINVPDLDAAMTWYAETLGLRPDKPFALPSGMRGVMLLHQPSGYRIELLQQPDARPDGKTDVNDGAALGYGHICLRTPDVTAEYSRLLDAGCTSRLAPAPAPRPGATVCFLYDPWGNLLEVLNRD